MLGYILAFIVFILAVKYRCEAEELREDVAWYANELKIAQKGDDQ